MIGKNARSQSLESRECRLELGALGDAERGQLRRLRERRLARRSDRSRSGCRRSSTRTPRRAILSSYAGPIPAPCCPDFLARRAHRVDELVIREHEVNAIAHIEPSLHVDAVRDQLIDLREQRVGIENDAVSDRASNAGMKNAARNLVEDE